MNRKIKLSPEEAAVVRSWFYRAWEAEEKPEIGGYAVFNRLGDFLAELL